MPASSARVAPIEWAGAIPGTVDPEPLSTDGLLPPPEIDVYRQRLQHLWDGLLASITWLEAKATQTHDGAGEGDPVKAAWLHSLTQREIADKRLSMQDVMCALEKIRENTYGRCVLDGAVIPQSVLEEVPWAIYCPDCVARCLD